MIAAIDANDIGRAEELLKTEQFNNDYKTCVWNLMLYACNQERVEIVDLFLKDKRFDQTIDCLLIIACHNKKWAVVPRLLQDKRIDPAGNLNNPIFYSVFYKNADISKLLLLDDRVDVKEGFEAFFKSSVKYEHDDRILDLLTAHLKSDLQNIPGCIERIGQVQTRFSTVCIGMQDLCLPALVTLEILDALLPNDIRMAAKWDLIVAVKHFHNRRKKK